MRSFFGKKEEAAAPDFLECSTPVEASQSECWVSGRTKSLKGEDRFATMESVIGGETIQWMLVADGHGGKDAADLVASHFLRRASQEAVDGNAS